MIIDERFYGKGKPLQLSNLIKKIKTRFPKLYHSESLNNDLYKWAVINLTEQKIANYFKSIAIGGVKRYLLPNINAMNYILFDSLNGGGSESLFNDAQGKTHGQALLKMEVVLPKEILKNK